MFFKDLVHESDSQILMHMLAFSKSISLNSKETDCKLAALIQPYVEKWRKEFQEFLNASKEQKQEILADPKKRLRIIKLGSYLEKKHLKELRGKFPSLATENLQMSLRQEKDIEKCLNIIKMQLNLKYNTIFSTIASQKKDEFKGCNCCCEEKSLVVFTVCKHAYCCKECASKLVSCPLCRIPLNRPVSPCNNCFKGTATDDSCFIEESGSTSSTPLG